MLIKIHQKKTAYFLLRVNGWFAIILLVAASCIHWDETITGYNLARKKTIPVDVKFLLTLSDKTLPLLEQNPDVLDIKADTIRGEGEYLYRSVLTPRQLFEERKRNFIDEQKKLSWLSWNGADAYVKGKLISATFTSVLNK